MIKGKIFRFLGQEGYFLGTDTTIFFYCKSLPFDFFPVFPYIYCVIKVMKETYLPEINEMYQRIATKLQQLDSHPQQPKSEQLEKLEVFKAMLERMITFL
ncbi:hypothetical protein NC653_008116 [Populus alba x Populus x berolinensis]|uniref:Uncharacterized protein n=1 Tax=Populus alba x Populus x berolinensis TaxID=444605 RepID=A0AAD6R6S4_9ROSI|nr:hypothetical protein NC653_008116 [Populus alba x Populus x berolinensis]